MRFPLFGTFLSAVSTLALSGCNSTTALESMEAMPRSNITTSSVVPIQSVSEAPDVIAYAESKNSQAAQAAKMIQEPRQTQTAALRPQPVKSSAKSVAKRAAKSSGKNKPHIYKAKFTDRKPINFGKASPKHFAVHGVDVSRWQYDINWKQLRSRGANFTYIKATEGGDHLDPMFKTNWNAAAKAGVPRGAYHFFYWCRVASEQADWFIRNVPKVKGALPPVLDVEWNNHSKTCPKRPSKSLVLKKMAVFIKKIEAHYGQKPIIYTAPDFYEDNLQGKFKDYPFWLRSVAAHPKKRYPNRDFIFWQYSGTGLSKGHGTEIDLNVFNGSKNGWYKWLDRNLL